MMVLMFILSHVCFAMSETFREGHFRQIDGIISVTDLLKERNLISKSNCFASCLATPSCRSAGMNKKKELCRLYDACPDPGIPEDTDWKIYSLNGFFKDFVWIDDWILAFRGIPHVNVSIYDVYTTPGLSHDSVCGEYIPDDCLNIKSPPGSCDRHFRSKVLDMWNQYSITMVRILLYKDGDVVGNVTFDSTGSNMTSWMTYDKVIDSSWPDLIPSAINYCAFEGHPKTSRRLYLNHDFNGCGGDAGWIMIIDNLESLICAYETPVTSYPVLFYGIGANTVWANPTTRGEADSVSILVKIAT